MALCIVGIGLPLGLAFGLLVDSIGMGVAGGVAVGVCLGSAFSGQRQEASKPLIIAGAGLLAAGIVVVAIVMHLVHPQWWCGYPILNLIPGC